MTAIYEKMRSLNSYPVSQALHRSAHSKCGIERFKQGRIAERFEQALNGTLFEHACTDGLICLSGDENDRNRFPAKRPLPLQIGSGHAGHGAVETETPGLRDAIGRQELFSRRERPSRIAKLPQQVG